MNRKKALVRNLLIAGFCILLIYMVTGVFPTAEMAFRTSERSSHYGPSQIICTVDNGSSRRFFGAYEEWSSVTDIRRQPLPFAWTIGNQVLGMERKRGELAEPRLSTFSSEDDSSSESDSPASRPFLVYGFVNSADIVSLELTTADGNYLHANRRFATEDKDIVLRDNPAAGYWISAGKEDFFLFSYALGPDSPSPGGSFDSDSPYAYYDCLRGYDSAGSLIYEYSVEKGVTVPAQPPVAP